MSIKDKLLLDFRQLVDDGYNNTHWTVRADFFSHAQRDLRSVVETFCQSTFENFDNTAYFPKRKVKILPSNFAKSEEKTFLPKQKAKISLF